MLKYFVYLQRSSSIIIFIFCCILHRVAIFGLNNHKDNVKSRLHIHFFFFSIRNMWKYIPHRERTLRSTCKNYFFSILIWKYHLLFTLHVRYLRVPYAWICARRRGGGGMKINLTTSCNTCQSTKSDDKANFLLLNVTLILGAGDGAIARSLTKTDQLRNLWRLSVGGLQITFTTFPGGR